MKYFALLVVTAFIAQAAEAHVKCYVKNSKGTVLPLHISTGEAGPDGSFSLSGNGETADTQGYPFAFSVSVKAGEAKLEVEDRRTECRAFVIQEDFPEGKPISVSIVSSPDKSDDYMTLTCIR